MLIGRKKIIICILVLLAGGCSSPSKKITKTENQVLNKLLLQAAITTINLDSIPVDTVLKILWEGSERLRLPPRES